MSALLVMEVDETPKIFSIIMEAKKKYNCLIICVSGVKPVKHKGDHDLSQSNSEGSNLKFKSKNKHRRK